MSDLSDLSRFEMPPTERNQLILAQTKVHTRCRVCSYPITPVLTLGELFVSDFPKRLEDRGPKVPLTLAVCDNPQCRLVQLTHTVPRDALYRTTYWYRSGLNESMRKELKDVAAWGLMRVGELTPNDVIMDIGANDGTLLREMRKLWDEGENIEGIPGLWAVEPSPSFQATLWHGPADNVICDYFPPSRIVPVPDPLPKLIFTIACFYDLEDPNAFVAEIKRILHKDGIWVVQMGDLASMLVSGGFDTICHEHLEYYSLQSFMRLIARHGLRVVDVTPTPVNGGSLRIAVEHVDERERRCIPVSTQCYVEQGICPDPLLALKSFASRVQSIATRIQGALLGNSLADQPLELLGASTKGNTLLQRLNLGPELCRRAIERSPEKAGRMTVTGIPICSEEEGRVDPAPLRLITPWHFKDGLVKREESYLKRGGKLLFPLPEPVIVEWRDGQIQERRGR